MTSEQNTPVSDNHYEPVADETLTTESGRKGGAWSLLMKARGIAAHLPQPIKRFVRRFLPVDTYTRNVLMTESFYYAKPESDYPARVPITLGIIKEHRLRHRYPLGACRDMGVPYKLIDISQADWLDRLHRSGCDIFLVHPSVHNCVVKQMYDERLKIIEEDLGKRLYPSHKETWLYESKRRMHYWMDANGIPHPKTWVFYDPEKALEFAGRVELPVIHKTDLGSSASGVRIFRNRKTLESFVRKCFKRGIVRRDGDPREREWGVMLFQEYIPNVREWRMIRVGDSYFGYEKIKVNDFHSGSHAWDYSRPPVELLELLREVTEKGRFSSMDVDVFMTQDGRLLVNELQTVFGLGNPYEMCVVDEKPGRMLRDAQSGDWKFEAGRFCQNHMWNLRIDQILREEGLI